MFGMVAASGIGARRPRVDSQNGHPHRAMHLTERTMRIRGCAHQKGRLILPATEARVVEERTRVVVHAHAGPSLGVAIDPKSEQHHTPYHPSSLGANLCSRWPLLLDPIWLWLGRLSPSTR